MNATEAPELTGGLELFGQVALILIFIILVILGCAWLFRRFSGVAQAAGGLLKVVGSVGVGQRERVVIVSVGDTWLVLGVASGQVRKLHEMPAQQPPAKEDSQGFARRFQQALNKQLNNKSGSSE
ncbi:hypothetical protein IDSA_07675 [Pseudidiomarina salinarum]|uniref:Flagellar protein n=1 Tax=Pseudidiomarina salinarum TaxID=435908 RepID=A0A094JEF2_9GAMM|nr:flagellar biosynthetic protein FliO [Pseudidiomarina salinarum]KFZ30941.1 hypothetical protein IDSA_07675 [Pseudidiomarina salinarum]RUO71429.1 flagellar biosynthetic protein FliO [Pseudidiomarina salinarum]